MKEYLNILQKILDEGVEKESGRVNMPNTIGISKADISMNLSDGFPLLTTKKMYFKGIVHELLWFLRGETNIKYLVDNNVNIWNGDAYRWYLKTCEENNIKIFFDEDAGEKEGFIDYIKNLGFSEYNYRFGEFDKHMFDLINVGYHLGNLGKVYGYQWRNQNGVDQIQEIMDGLKANPYSRYHILDGWNKADFKDMSLPPCHLLYQFIVRPLTSYEREDIYAEIHGFSDEQRCEMNPNAPDDVVHKLMDEDDISRFYLDLNMYQRSCDIFLGVPFNIASMSLLLMIIAEASNMIAGVANWIGGDTHMYVSHLDAVNEQLSRTPTKLPQVLINKNIKTLEDICNLTINDIILKDYESQDKIKAELFTGLKK